MVFSVHMVFSDLLLKVREIGSAKLFAVFLNISTYAPVGHELKLKYNYKMNMNTNSNHFIIVDKQYQSIR